MRTRIAQKLYRSFRSAESSLLLSELQIALEVMQKFDHLPLCPPSVIAIRIGDKRTMAAIRLFHKHQVGICGDFLARFGKQAHEWIVRSMQNQSRDSNAINHIRRGRARIVIHRPFETAVVRRDLVVKLSQATQSAQTLCIKLSRKQLRFIAESP